MHWVNTSICKRNNFDKGYRWSYLKEKEKEKKKNEKYKELFNINK